MDILVKMLLEGQARVDLKDPKSRETPLFLAAKRGHETVVKLLLEVKADVNLGDYSQVPLFVAVEGGHESIVKLYSRLKPTLT